jgi:peptidoglycan/LPS O-acetylase OafA/YrhL
MSTVNAVSNPLLLQGHHLRLDSLRTIAALAVLAVHTRTHGGLAESAHPIDNFLDSLFRYGSYGVDLFLVISGYLITSILIDSRYRPGALKRFWIRRSLRIFPLFYLYLFVASVLFAVTGNYGLLTAEGPPMWHHLLFITNIGIWYYGYAHFALSHLWSISLEEQFYILWSVLMIGGLWRAPSLKFIGWLTAAGLLGAIFFRTILARTVGVEPGFFLQLHTRWDGLGLGVLLALAARHQATAMLLCKPVTYLSFILGGVVIVATTFPYQPIFHELWVFGLQPFALSVACCGLVLAVLANDRLTFWASWHWLQYLGKISYGIYMWHCLAVCIVIAFAPPPPEGFRLLYYSGYFLVSFLITLVMSLASWYGFEWPILKHKDRIAPSDRHPSAGAKAP